MFLPCFGEQVRVVACSSQEAMGHRKEIGWL